MKSTKKIIRVFIDTNILISGIIFKGNEHKILNLCIKKKINLLLSEYVIKEAHRVFSKKFPEHLYLLKNTLDILNYELIKIPKKEEIKKHTYLTKDITDLPIVISAINAKPDYFISGDKDFFTNKIRQKLKVVTSKEFLDIFRKIQ